MPLTYAILNQTQQMHSDTAEDGEERKTEQENPFSWILDFIKETQVIAL